MAGCTQLVPGGDRDEHGCIPSAGYAWCEEKQKCLRIWEENCTSLIVGNDSDAHGCKASAGYSWCEEKQACIRPWEENCTPLLVGNDSDKHGCKASAGYSWCAVTEKCIRQWEEPCKAILTFNEAWQIAANSSCMQTGNLTGDSGYNNITKTWWLDLDTVTPGCAPACVVVESDRTAEVNWRCTGTVPG
jgi:hypothetical protein